MAVQLNDISSLCVLVFDSVKGPATLFVLPLFLVRVSLATAVGSGHQAFMAMKGAITYFILISAFPFILELLFSIPESFKPDIGQILTETHATLLTAMPLLLDRILGIVVSGLYWIAFYLHYVFMIFMSGIAPLVFLLGSLLGIGLGLEIFLGLLIMGSSWPIIWFGFDKVHIALMQVTENDFGRVCLEILITFFKGVAPLMFASFVMKSPVGQAIGGAVKSAAATGNFAIGVGNNLRTSFRTQEVQRKTTASFEKKRNIEGAITEFGANSDRLDKYKRGIKE